MNINKSIKITLILIWIGLSNVIQASAPSSKSPTDYIVQLAELIKVFGTENANAIIEQALGKDAATLRDLSKRSVTTLQQAAQQSRSAGQSCPTGQAVVEKKASKEHIISFSQIVSGLEDATISLQTFVDWLNQDSVNKDMIVLDRANKPSLLQFIISSVASQRGIIKAQLVQQLLKFKPNVNHKDEQGKTALMHAIELLKNANSMTLDQISNARDIVKFLVQSLADITLRDKTGKSAVDYANEIPNADLKSRINTLLEQSAYYKGKSAPSAPGGPKA